MSAEETRMPFAEHLRELRKRLTISAAAVIAGFLVCYNFSIEIYGFLTSPLIAALPEGTDYMVFTGVVEPFFVYLKAGLAGGVIAASPVVLYEAWAFVAPGLYSGEKRWFAFVVIFSILLFASGVLFAYFVVFPFAFTYLLGFSTDTLKPMISMGDYFSLAVKLLIAFGVSFQLPLGMMVAARIGAATAGQFLRWWRYALVLVLIAAAILTPTPDVFNQMLMAGPLMLLYLVGVAAAAIFGKKKAAEEGDEGAREPAGGK